MLKLYDQIAKMEYNIQWQDAVGTSQVPNRAHNLRFTLWNTGFTAERRDPRRGPGEPLETWKAA